MNTLYGIGSGFALFLLVVLSLPADAQAQVDLDLTWERLGDSEGVLGEERGVASVESAEFSPDGSLILSGAKRGGDVVLWTAGGQELWRRYHANRAEVEVVTFTKDGLYAVTGGEDGYIRVWRVSDGAAVQAFTLGGSGVNISFDGMRFSPDGTLLATGDERGQLSLWDTSDPDPANWPTVPVVTVVQGPDQDRPGGGSGHADINSIDWTADGAELFTGGRDATVKRWDASALAPPQGGLLQTYTGFLSSIKSTRLAPDGQLVAAGGQDSPEGLVLVWDVASGQVVRRIDYTTNRKIEAVEWTPDGRFLFTGGVEGRDEPPYENNGGFGPIRAYDREAGFALVLEQVTFRQEYFDFDAGGDRMVSSHEDGGLRLWDVIYGSTDVQQPFGGTPASLPGRLEAEHFDEGGPGIAYSDSDVTNRGGASLRPGEAVDVYAGGGASGSSGSYGVGWIGDGEWLEFTVEIGQAGSYELTARVATPQSGRDFHVEVGGADVTGTIDVPNTGGWAAWQTVTTGPFGLEAGAQVVRLALDDGPFNLDWVEFAPADDPVAAFPEPGVWYELTNAQTGQRMESAAGGVVQTTPSSGADAQRWQFVEAEPGTYRIDNAVSGRGALDTDPGGVIEWVGESATNGDRWTVEAVGDGSYRFRTLSDGRDYLYAEASGAVRWNTGATGDATRWTPAASAAAQQLDDAASLQAGTVAPTAFALEPAYPNPFNPQTTIRYALPEPTAVRLSVYDALGRQVAQLFDGEQAAGRHAVTFDARHLAGGTYFVRIEAGAFTQVRQVVLVK